MTPKQVETLQNRIKKIKRALAADKKRWGGYYDDSRGLRYLPPELYLKLQDYSGALRYFNWFNKNFPDDTGQPFFLFEWTITLFKKGRIAQAGKKALETFFSNTYLLDKFLDKEPHNLELNENSNWQQSILVNYFEYSKDQDELRDFAEWLDNFMSSEEFKACANRFIEIEIRLKTEPAGPQRTALVRERYSLLDDDKNA